MKKILFQGDSITDAGRDKARDASMGTGYARLVAAHLAYEQPEEYECINRGISGNRIVDVYARIKKDIINLAPDYMSMLIGVNDVWHEIHQKNGVDVEKFERMYDLLIGEVLEALPDLKIMIMGAYYIKGSATEDYMEDFARVPQYAAAARRIAEKYHLPFIDLQQKFDEALERGCGDVWSPDGVHPGIGGIELIKRAWLEGFEKLV